MTTDAPSQDLMASGPLLSRQQVADKLNVSRATVYRLIRAGEIRAYRIGHSIRVAQVDLENYVLAQPPPTQPEKDHH